jgi:hypothetical protein
MARPGVIFTESAAPASRGAPTDTATLFVSGVTKRGPVNQAVLLRSIGDYTRTYGDRVAGNLYDYVDVFFREGGSRVYVARQVGPGAVAATVNIPGATGTSIVATAKAPGTYYNDLDVKAVASGGGFKLQVLDGAGVLIFESAELASKADAPGVLNDYVTFTAGAGAATPTTGATAYSLTGGTEGAAITQTEKNASLALFGRTLGPGRVAAPGDTTAAMHAALSAHAAANNRIAFADLADTPTVGTLTSAAATNAALGNSDRLAQFAGSVLVPGPGGTTRTVPLSAAVAGVEARKDRRGDVGLVAAFDDFPFSYVIGLSQTYSDADIDTLVAAGVNVAKDVFGALELFSYVTAQPRTDGTYWMLNAANIRMAIQAQAERIGYAFLGKTVDGQGRAFGALEGALKGMLLRFFDAGSLFGELPGDAFEVVADFSVNPTAQLAAGEVYASLNVRISPYAEMVTIDLVTTPITSTITA